LLDPQRLAAHAVARVLGGRNLSQVLAATFTRHAALPPQQRALLQDLCYGTLRHYGRLSAVLGLLLRKPPKDEEVRCLLLVALYQLQYTQAAPHSVVDNAVSAVHALKKSSAKGLVNAVLRNFLRGRDALQEQTSAASDEARYSYPAWWIDKLRQQYPTDWAAILEAGNRHPPMALRINQRHTSVLAYLDMLGERGIAARAAGETGVILARPCGVDELPGFRDGLVSVQDIGAQYAAPLLDVRDGMRVLDACAAPGGKTAHLLECAGVELTALDSDTQRLEKVEQNLQRLQLQACCVVGDAARPGGWWDGKPFDRILADVPCSASGVVRRHPDIKWLRREPDIAQFAAQQARMLEALWRCLARDGKLLYATCSVFGEENHLQIAAFLARHPDASLLPLPGLSEQDLQLLPDENHDGFYYALLARN
jgi:16S rRNA (cytosine967-C5)-methyltransferase